MPPKRKRAAAEAATTTSTRATRSSARNGDAAASDTASTAPAVDEDVPTEDPKPKRSRKAAAKSTKATTAKSTASKAQPTRAEGGGSSGNSANTSVVSTAKPPKAVKSAKTSVAEPEPYSAADANALFGKYADEDDPEVIGPAGLEKLCGDADIPLEGPLPLLMAWQFRASEMAKVTKSEWESGTSALQISSLSALSIALHDLHDLLILNKPALKPPTTTATAPKKKTAEPYNRTRYYQYAKDKSKAFNEFYLFCFMLVKPPQGRNIEMEVASAFWTVLLVPQYELMQEILEFIAEKGTYKGVNKDLWQMVLEFCQTVSPSLENFEADGAWPTMLDEFVAWKKAK